MQSVVTGMWWRNQSLAGGMHFSLLRSQHTHLQHISSSSSTSWLTPTTSFLEWLATPHHQVEAATLILLSMDSIIIQNGDRVSSSSCSCCCCCPLLWLSLAACASSSLQLSRGPHSSYVSPKLQASPDNGHLLRACQSCSRLVVLPCFVLFMFLYLTSWEVAYSNTITQCHLGLCVSPCALM